MKHLLRLIFPMVAAGVLVFCSHASAGLIPAGQVDYQYVATAKDGAWIKVVDPGYGSPQWQPFPALEEDLIYVPNQAQSNKVKHFWFEVQWQNDLAVPEHPPVLWVPQGFTATGGADPVHVTNGYVWEWTITPQPNRELVEIPDQFPWLGSGTGVNNVTQIIVASKCVPEPSTLVLAAVGGMVLFGAGRRWRRA